MQATKNLPESNPKVISIERGRRAPVRKVNIEEQRELTHFYDDLLHRLEYVKDRLGPELLEAIEQSR